MRCVRASNVPHTSEQKVHSTFNCGSSQATTRVLVVKTGIEVLRQKSKSIRGQTERTRRHLRNDYRLTDGQKTSRNIDPMRLQQICFGYSRLACSPSASYSTEQPTGRKAFIGTVKHLPASGLTVSSSHTSATSFVGIPMDSMITKKV